MPTGGVTHLGIPFSFSSTRSDVRPSSNINPSPSRKRKHQSLSQHQSNFQSAGKGSKEENVVNGDDYTKSGSFSKLRKESSVPSVEDDSILSELNGTVEFAADSTDESSHHSKKDKKKKKSGGFQSLCLSSPLLRGIFSMGYNVPTPIQRRAIPILLAGHDLVAMARTGSGKTAAFLIPLIEKLLVRTDTTSSLAAPVQKTPASSNSSPIRAIVLSPTRELAMQTYTAVQSLTKHFPVEDRFNTALLIGGSSMNQQFEAIDKQPALIIATPGRLMHHLIEVGFSLKFVEFCVFDEADRLFELGFAFQLAEILKKLGPNRQTALFSATLPSQLVEFSRAGLKDPKVVRLDAESKISPLLQMAFFTLRKDQKPAALLFLLRKFPTDEQTIIFTATRHHVDYLHSLLTAASLDSTYVYGQLDAAARKINIAKFRSRKVNVLIVTDVAARGIDLPLLDNVINYDFTSKPKLFVHRVGRVARAGRSGKAYSLVAPDEVPYMIDLFLFIGRPLLNQPIDQLKEKKSSSSSQSAEEGTRKEQENGTSNDSVYYGSLPPTPLSLEEDYIRTLHNSVPHLSTQFAVAERAYALYYKTRGSASNASAQRQKEFLQNIRLHPLFLLETDIADQERQRLIEAVRGFRSSRTVFEIEEHKNAVMNNKRRVHEKLITKNKILNAKQQQSPEDERKEVEKESIENDARDEEREEEEKEEEQEIEEEKNQGLTVATHRPHKSKKQRLLEKKFSASSQLNGEHINLLNNSHLPPSSYRDPNFFISMTPSSSSTSVASDRDDSYAGISSSSQSLSALSLDFIGDDTSSLLQTRNVQRWDSRKKKYVTVKEGGDPYRKQRNESGEIVKLSDKSKPALYQKWKKLKHKRPPGATADTNGQEYMQEEGEGGREREGKRGKKRMRGPAGPDDDHEAETRERSQSKGAVKRKKGVKGDGRNELKSVDEIRKMRKVKEKNRLKNSKKGKGKGRGKNMSRKK